MATTAPAAQLRKIFGSGYKDGVRVIHFTDSQAKDYSPRLRPLCGQRSRSAYNTVSAEATVNCEKCLNVAVPAVTTEQETYAEKFERTFSL
jgi:hypothetical protein